MDILNNDYLKTAQAVHPLDESNYCYGRVHLYHHWSRTLTRGAATLLSL